MNLIKHPITEFIIFLAIIANSITLSFQSSINLEIYFISIFTIEIILKIISFGFSKFFKDSWNIFDSIIVFTSLLPILLKNNENLRISIFRSIRILRPLRTISSIQSLKIVLIAFFSSIPLLIDTLLIVIFFFFIFAIIGLNIFSGALKKKCFRKETGIFFKVNNKFQFCGNLNCEENFICGKLIENPNFGVSNFDNIFNSIFQVFQCITLEGWSEIMLFMFQGFSEISFLYFFFIVIFGSFFLIKIVLAVLKAKFTESKKNFSNKKISNVSKDKILMNQEKYEIIENKLIPLFNYKQNSIDNNSSESSFKQINKMVKKNICNEKFVLKKFWLKVKDIRMFFKIKFSHHKFSKKRKLKKKVENLSINFHKNCLNKPNKLQNMMRKSNKLFKIIINQCEYFSSSQKDIM